MNKITIISGSPGSGKTTLASSLAHQSPKGVHLITDDFYHFLAHRLDPSSPESKLQNTSVVRSFMAAAMSFSQSGFDVFVDGVIGPWWRTEILNAVSECNYVILAADLQAVVKRVGTRANTHQASASPEIAQEMHRQFFELEDVSERTIDTTDKSQEAVLTEFKCRSTNGEFSYP